MRPKFEDILDYIITETEKGKNLDNLLEAYPEYKNEIKELIEVSREIRQTPKPEPGAVMINKTLDRIRAMDQGKLNESGVQSIPGTNLFKPVLAPILATILLILLTGWVGLSFSTRSVPGDFLYPVKLAAEQIQYTLTFKPDGKANLHVVYANKRSDELFQKFKRDSTVSKTLIQNMLEETEYAMALTGKVGGEYAGDLMMKIHDLSHAQKKMLEDIKPLAFCCDTSIINEAIKCCCANDNCIQMKMDLRDSVKTCPCDF